MMIAQKIAVTSLVFSGMILSAHLLMRFVVALESLGGSAAGF